MKKKILSFNTVLKKMDIFIQNGVDIIYENNIETNKQSEIIITSIEESLNKVNLKYSDIDIFSAVVGPGFFTGIKTGLTCLKGIKIATNKPIITNNLFEILSYGENNFDIVALYINPNKYYIKEGSLYYTIKRENFVIKNKKILTNDSNLIGTNVKYSQFTTEKWKNTINYKIKNNIFTEEIKPLYIESPSINLKK